MDVTEFYKCKLEKVVDGDTVRLEWIQLGFDVFLHNQIVRLYGIDTPESRTSNLEEKKYGLLAKQRLTELLDTDNLILNIHLDESRGKFGRILGTFIVDGININEKLVSEGHAVEYYGQSKELVQEQHLKNRLIIDEKIQNSTQSDY